MSLRSNFLLGRRARSCFCNTCCRKPCPLSNALSRRTLTSASVASQEEMRVLVSWWRLFKSFSTRLAIILDLIVNQVPYTPPSPREEPMLTTVVLRYAADLVSKKTIAKRLQWIISSRPDANPSRVTLKRVNEYLLTSPDLRRTLVMPQGHESCL